MSKTLHAHLGIRLAARRLGVTSLPVPEVQFEPDLPVPMRDGTVLLGNRWTPMGSSSAPLVLVRTPYGRGSAGGFLSGRMLAHQGFQVVVQSCRGTDGSGGALDRPFQAEAEDGQDTVDWLRQQSWYPGTFATTGGSYLGYTQLALAQVAPEEHVAAVLTTAPTSLRDLAWPDDTFSTGVALRWAVRAAHDPTATLRHVLTARRTERNLRQAAAEPPLLQSYLGATGRRLPFVDGWLEAEDRDAPLRKELDQSAGLDALRGPVLIQAGWYDIFLDSSFRQYTSLRERGVDVRLTVGPWSHQEIALNGLPDTIEFLREVLFGDAPRAGGSRVRCTDVFGDEEHRLDEWPGSTREQIFFLSPGRLTSSQADAASQTTYTYDPADPTPQLGGALLDMRGAGATDNRPLEARADVVTFDSEPLPALRTLRGTASVDMTFASDRPATCVFVRLCDVAPDGTSTNLTDRMVPLAANGTSEWRVHADLPPVSAVLRVGHRLRMQVSSGATPRFLPHSGTDEPQASAPRRFPARQTLHHSKDRPATVSVPFIELST